jgi:hypothetical protein
MKTNPNSSISLDMDFQHLFEINPRHRVLICKSCQYAIVPAHFKTHLQVYHSRLSLQQRRDFTQEVESDSNVARVHEDVVYPLLTDPPVESLPVYFDGLRCTWASNTDVCPQGVQQPNQFAKVCLNCLPRNSSNLSSRVGQTVQS